MCEAQRIRSFKEDIRYVNRIWRNTIKIERNLLKLEEMLRPSITDGLKWPVIDEKSLIRSIVTAPYNIFFKFPFPSV